MPLLVGVGLKFERAEMQMIRWMCGISLYISSVYSPFSNVVELPLHNSPFSGVLMKSIREEFLRPDALPGVNHMRGMQYNIYIYIYY